MKKYYKTRKPYYKKRKPWYHYKNVKGYAGAAITALAIAKQVKSMMNVEYKFINTETTNENVSSSGYMECLTLCAQGDTDVQRDGDQIRAKYMAINGYFTRHASATLTQIRMTIITTPQKHDDTTPTLTLLRGGASNLLAGLNKDNTKRYRVIHDKLYTLDDQNPQRTFKVFKKFKNLKPRYGATTAVETATRENNVYVFFVSNEATNVPQVNFYSRIRFIDN